MGYYLCFKKNNVDIYSVPVSSALGQCFTGAPWDKWKVCSPEILERALAECKDNIRETQIQIKNIEEALTVIKDTEDIYSAIDEKHQKREELSAFRQAAVSIQILKEICEQPVYDQTDDWNEIPTVFEYGVF